MKKYTREFLDTLDGARLADLVISELGFAVAYKIGLQDGCAEKAKQALLEVEISGEEN